MISPVLWVLHHIGSPLPHPKINLYSSSKITILGQLLQTWLKSVFYSLTFSRSIWWYKWYLFVFATPFHVSIGSVQHFIPFTSYFQKTATPTVRYSTAISLLHCSTFQQTYNLDFEIIFHTQIKTKIQIKAKNIFKLEVSIIPVHSELICPMQLLHLKLDPFLWG